VCENSNRFKTSGDQCLRQCENNCPKGTYCDEDNLQADQLKYKDLLPFDQGKYCKCTDENKKFEDSKCVCKEGFLNHLDRCYRNLCESDCGKGSCEFNGEDAFECDCDEYAILTDGGCVLPECKENEKFIGGKCVRQCKPEFCPDTATCKPDVIAKKGTTEKEFCECPNGMVLSRFHEEYMCRCPTGMVKKGNSCEICSCAGKNTECKIFPDESHVCMCKQGYIADGIEGDCKKMIKVTEPPTPEPVTFEESITEKNELTSNSTLNDESEVVSAASSNMPYIIGVAVIVIILIVVGIILRRRATRAKAPEEAGPYTAGETTA